jgi:predicted porin
METVKIKNAKRVSILAAGVAAGLVTAGAHAAGPTLYGQFNVSLDHLDNDADSALNISSNASRIGIKGEIDIQEGLKALYQAETEIRTDNGEGTWATRDTFLGLQGKFGTVRAGQIDTPVKVIGRRADLFGDQVGDARNITRVNAGAGFARFDERTKNSINYVTPNFSGLQGVLHYSTNIDTGTTADNKNDLVSVAVQYVDKAAFISAGYEQVGNNGEGDDPSAFRIGGYYDLDDAWRFTALWQTVSGVTSAADYDSWGIGARYKLDKWAFKGQYYQLSGEGENSDANQISVGVEYALAKPVTLYLVYATLDNDDGRALSAYAQGHGDNLAPAAGDTSSGISLGTIVKF